MAEELFEETTQNESPLAVLDFQPDDSDNVLLKLSPSDFDLVQKILNKIISSTKSSNSLIIYNGKIHQKLGEFADLHVDLGEINDSLKNLTLHIYDAKRSVKAFKTLKGNNSVYIMDDSENERFVVTNGELKILLAKIAEEIVSDEAELQESMNEICSFNVDKESIDRLTNLMSISGKDYVDFLLHSMQVKCIDIPEVAICVLRSFINDPDARKLDETTAELSLRSYSFLRIPAEECDCTIYEESGNHVLISTYKNAGLPNIKVIEMLENTTDSSPF